VSVQRDRLNSIKVTLSSLEKVDSELIELFGDDSDNHGLFANRAELLQQFSMIANAFHQLHTITYLENSPAASSVFGTEIRSSKERVHLAKENSIKIIEDKVKFLTTQVEKILDSENQIIIILNMLKSNTHLLVPLRDSKQFAKVKIKNSPKLNQSIIFSLEEIRSKILVPARNIVNLEIAASYKIMESLALHDAEKSQVTAEEIARMCELLSWGLDSTNSWEKIRSVRDEISQSIQKELGALRSLLLTGS
jgi:hypothetical protein